MKQIVPNLWFERQAEDAANFYVSVFPNSRILRKSHYGKEGFEIHKMPDGTVMTIEFELNGNRFVGLNGGPHFKFNEAISFIVYCDTQEELDHYWNKLTDGGDKNSQQCGWLKDKFGLSWQVVPSQLEVMMLDPDKKRAGRVMKAMLKMKKLDIGKLQAAYDGLVEQV